MKTETEKVMTDYVEHIQGRVAEKFGSARVARWRLRDAVFNDRNQCEYDSRGWFHKEGRAAGFEWGNP